MSYRITFLPTADCDMGDIEEYLAQFDLSSVLSFFLKMEKQVLMLEDTPYLCPAYDEDPFFRWMVVEDYLLFYSVDEKRHFVIIHRVFHASKDVRREMSARQMPE